MRSRQRECYAGIAEFSVYVARQHRGKGAGRLARAALIDAATTAGFWKLVSRIFPENTASLALMARMGFRRVGVYCRHGMLDGEWGDCFICQTTLSNDCLVTPVNSKVGNRRAAVTAGYPGDRLLSDPAADPPGR